MGVLAQQKLEAIAALEKGERLRDVAKRYGVATATVHYWKSKHERGESLDTMPAKQTRKRTVRTDDVKREILAAMEAAPLGSKKAVLARHGVSRSTADKWAALLTERPTAKASPSPAQAPRERTPPARGTTDLQAEVDRLRAENDRLRRMLKVSIDE